MSDPILPSLPSYAKIPNGSHEPNVTPPGIMVVEDSRKMAKTLMKMSKPKVQLKSTHRSTPRAPARKKDQTKWY
jgi:hypothetical protein